MKLTVTELRTMDLAELTSRDAEDYTEITKVEYKNIIDDANIDPTKKDVVHDKFVSSRFLIDERIDPDGVEYYDEITDEIVEYIPLDRLRFKIQETHRREVDENFELGRKAWGIVIEEAEIGERVDDSFIAYDDIDPCYKAISPATGQAGFNAKCLDQFYTQNIERILTIVDRVNKEIKIEQDAQREIANFTRRMEKRAERAKLELRGEA